MNIAIVGAGIAGLTAAAALKNKDINTVLFEAAPEVRAEGAGLALAANAIRALDIAGLKEGLPRGQLLNALTIYDHHGKVITKTDTEKKNQKYGEDNFTIHRTDLHSYLLDQLSPDNVFTRKKLTSLKQNEHKVTLLFEDGSAYEADYAIIADGIHSVARQQLLPQSKPRYAGYTCWRAVVNGPELQLPDASEIWGPQGRFGIVPLTSNKVYWFACVSSPRNSEEMKQYGIQELLRQFEGYPHDVGAVLRETEDQDLLWNDIIDLKPISRFAFDRIVLMGDAAHATTPNMGQGACMAIEDAVWLAEALDGQHHFQQVFKDFEQARKKRVHWITKTSWKLGKIAQVANPVLGAMRNFLFRLAPSSFNDKQLQRLYDVNFPDSEM